MGAFVVEGYYPAFYYLCLGLIVEWFSKHNSVELLEEKKCKKKKKRQRRVGLFV